MRTASKDPLLLGFSLSAKWIPALNRAIDLLRATSPNAPDDELLQAVLVAGIVSTITLWETPIVLPPANVILPCNIRRLPHGN